MGSKYKSVTIRIFNFVSEKETNASKSFELLVNLHFVFYNKKRTILHNEFDKNMIYLEKNKVKEENVLIPLMLHNSINFEQKIYILCTASRSLHS